MTFDYSMFDTLLEPLFIISKDQKVVYCNETAQALCGLSLRKMQRMKFSDILEFSEKLEWLDTLEAIKDPTPYKEIRFKTLEAQEGRIQITCREFPSQAEDRHWILFVRDVTLEERLQMKYRGELEQKEGYIEELKKAQAELEKYSKNLEKMVEERTQEITRLNQQMKALLDSLSQGFLIFDKDGKCLEVSSRACETVLECQPSGKNIWDIMKVPEKKVSGFKRWMSTVFDELLPFPDLVALAPQEFPHSEGKTISLEYFPLRGDAGKIEGVVVMASDITSLVEARRQAAEEREHASMIIKLIKNKKEISRFVREAQSLLSHLRVSLKEPAETWSREELYRILHTVKGGSASFSVTKTAEFCHQAEQILTEYKTEPTPEKARSLQSKCTEVESSFQEYIQSTKDILGEKGLSETRFVEMPVPELMTVIQKVSDWEKGQDLAFHLLKSYIMEPIGAFFEPYKELVQSVAQKEGKLVEELKLHNDSLPVLPEVYSPLLACLVHAFRNGIDHGIETPEIRQAAGKPEAGKIEVFFEITKKDHEHLQIKIVDDGGGINPDRIRNKLKEKGLPVEGKNDHQIIQHIFDSEFSTRDVVTETSGRGVGMDAILSAAKALGGKAWVDSVVGKGTTLWIEVPYWREVPQVKSQIKAA